MDRRTWWAIYSPWSCQEWDMTEHAETSLGSTKLEDLFFWPQL